MKKLLIPSIYEHMYSSGMTKNIVATILLILGFCATNAQINPIDSTFAVNGYSFLNIETYNWPEVSIDTDVNNRIIMAATVINSDGTFDFGIFKYSENGILDSTFGENGILLIDLGSDEDMVLDICVQSYSKILMAGTKGSFQDRDMVLLRLNNDGSLDTEFGNSGLLTINVLYDDRFHCVDVQPDGKILVGGTAYSRGYIYRINQDGSFDNTFGTNGCVNFTLGSSTAVLDIHSWGNKVIAGGQIAGSSSANAFFISFNTDGSYNMSFGNGGKYLLNTPNQEYLNTIAIQNDGKILGGDAFGYSGPAMFAYFMVMRLMPDGTLDLSFNDSGTILEYTLQNAANQCNTIEVDSAGNILACGYTGNVANTLNDIFIIKLKPDGSLDSTFATNGKFTSNLLSKFEKATDSFMDSEYKVVISGYSGSLHNPMLCRINTAVTTPVKDIIYKESILLYPNPCSQTLTISVSDLNEDVNIAIVNPAGQVIFQDNISASSHEDIRINTSFLLPGMYLLKFHTKSRAGISKFVKI